MISFSECCKLQKKEHDEAHDHDRLSVLTVPVTTSSTSVPTSMPSTEVGKNYNFQVGFPCGDEAQQILKDTESRLICKKACDDWGECFAFEWIGEDSFCGLYNNGIQKEKIKYTGEDDRVCALVVDKTDSPSNAPSDSKLPSPFPTEFPTNAPTHSPTMCEEDPDYEFEIVNIITGNKRIATCAWLTADPNPERNQIRIDRFCSS